MNDDYSGIDNEFVKENEYIIYKIFGGKAWIDDYQDILQEARIWLLDAKKTWKKEKSSWNTYATNYVIWAYKNYGRKKFTNKRTISANGYVAVGLDAINENNLFKGNLSDVYNNICEKSLDDEIQASSFYDYVMRIITDKREKDIFYMKLQGYNNREIGKKHSITHQRVWQILKKSIETIKENIKGDEVCL